ncbi:hypothetical protein LAZ67_10001914 [Cordylochernes scorpioides]|uniref:Transposase n=1 Tax=Cordylochernes scorpioides TaxID=51811 RepID=A0ABY6KWP9_9ARAC|nr:hypothetical protein LAZ67_10001914 [Cordylochernes scorpioides]
MPGHRKRRQFKQTDAFTRGMVIGLKRAGWSIRQIAADTNLDASTVHRLWRRLLEQGNVAINRNVGATRVTSARVDRRILRQAVAAPQATCTAILQHAQDTLDHSISTRTISRRLVANGLHSCRPLRRLPLTPPNRRQRLEWCRARSTWMTEWHRVVFSDESRFCLSSDSRRVRVWRRRGERSNPASIVERPTVRQRGIMVWGAIAYDSRSPLLRIQGTMTAQRYVDDVLRPVTLPYLQGVPNALYQQDNARPHTARISQQALQDVQMLLWPPYSPDLSPFEHVWDIIGRRLHALPQPRSEDELWQMTNIIYERFIFQKMDQKSGETISKYIIRLKEQAQRCNFGDFLQESLRDRFVAGIIDTPTQKKLLQEEGLTFEGALDIALSAESADKDLHNLKRSEDAHRSPQHLHAINNPCKHCVSRQDKMENKRDQVAKSSGDEIAEKRKKTTRRTLTAILVQLTAILQGVKMTRPTAGGTYAAHRLRRATGRKTNGATADTWPSDLTRHPKEPSPTKPDPYTSVQKKTK